MYLVSEFKLNRKYGITAPREQLYESVDQFVAALGGRISAHHIGVACFAIMQLLLFLSNCCQDSPG